MTKSQVPGVRRKPRPRPSTTTRTEDFITTGQGAGSIPATSLGTPVPAVLGRKRVPNPNTIWAGNLRPITKTTYETVVEIEEIDTGEYIERITVEKTTVTTTIEGYLCDIHMAVCLGPDVVLHAIYVDNQLVWSGTAGPLRTAFSLPEGETMLTGVSAVFSGGAFDQVPEPDISQPDYPGYVGIATVLLKDVRVDRPMGNISFEVSRVPNPLAVSDAVNRSDRDLNVISAIVEVITNEWGYGGLDIADVNTTALTTLAATLAGELNFCALKLDNVTGTASVLVSLLEQAGGILFQNPETGKLDIAIERPNEIDYASALALGPRNIVELRNFEKSTWGDSADTLRGLFTERDADYNEIPIYMPNVAKLSQSGRKRTTASIYYPFVTNRELLVELLARDMAVMAGPVFSFQVTTNRDGASRLPGSIVTVTKSEYGLVNTPCIVTRVRKHDRTNNTVTLSVRQAKLPDTSNYGVGGDPFDPGFDLSPKTPLSARIMTAPYAIARARVGINGFVLSPLNYPLLLVEPANNMQSDFDAYITNPPNAPTDVLVGEAMLYPTIGELSDGISKWDGTATGEIASVDLVNVVNAINLSSQGEAGVREGRYYVLIDDEVLSYETAVSGGGTSWTISNVHRGLLDTVAQDHAAGAKVYIIGGGTSAVLRAGFPDPIGWVPNFLLVPHTLTKVGTKSLGLSENTWPNTGIRTLSPPRPHNTKIDGQARSSTEVALAVGASCTVSWFTRSRVSLDVALQLDAAESPEQKGTDAQIHRVILVDSLGVEHDCGTSTGNSHTFTVPDAADGVGTLYVQAEMVLGGITYVSLFKDRLAVLVVADATFISEDSASYFADETGTQFFVSEAF